MSRDSHTSSVSKAVMLLPLKNSLGCRFPLQFSPLLKAFTVSLFGSVLHMLFMGELVIHARSHRIREFFSSFQGTFPTISSFHSPLSMVPLDRKISFLRYFCIIPHSQCSSKRGQLGMGTREKKRETTWKKKWAFPLYAQTTRPSPVPWLTEGISIRVFVSFTHCAVP